LWHKKNPAVERRPSDNSKDESSSKLRAHLVTSAAATAIFSATIPAPFIFEMPPNGAVGFPRAADAICAVQLTHHRTQMKPN
jgi:hypothetical protein